MTNETKSGIPMYMLFILALLGVPRVLAHDLKWLESGDVVNMLLVFIPPIVWLCIVLWKGRQDVFKSLLFIGIFYGVLLGIIHQILWATAFDSPPVLGGNLSDLSPAAVSILARTFGFTSSLATGAVIGAVLGFIGTFFRRIMPANGVR